MPCTFSQRVSTRANAANRDYEFYSGVHRVPLTLVREVKRDWERYATHPFGPGTNQTEMLSYVIKN